MEEESESVKIAGVTPESESESLRLLNRLRNPGSGVATTQLNVLISLVLDVYVRVSMSFIAAWIHLLLSHHFLNFNAVTICSIFMSYGTPS